MARQPGRDGAAWRRVRAMVLTPGAVCHLCGTPLKFGAPPRSRWAPSVDHVVPLKALRGLDVDEQRRVALNPAFLRAAHYGCNSRRGAGPVKERRKVSRRW